MGADVGSEAHFRVLRGVVFKGAVTDPDELFGLDRRERDSALDELAAGGLIENGELIAPTSRGVLALNQWYDAERDSLNEQERQALHERFRPLDRELKRIASAWQAAEARDDWNERLKAIEALEVLRRDLSDVLSDYIGRVPRLQEYFARLDRALEQIVDGRVEYVVSTSCDSYHTIWFQLHEDLLLLLAKERGSD